MPLANNCCPRRRWGKTELSIPVIPFGTQGFGDNFGPVTDAEAMALVRRAVDLGVNHFDCARCYGNSLGKLAPLCATIVERDRQLALVETLPIETLPLRAERPAARVGPSADLVDTDNQRAHLREVKRT